MDVRGLLTGALEDRVKSLRRRICACLFVLLIVLPQPAVALTANTLGDYHDVTVMEVSGSYDVGFFPNGSPDMSARRAIAKEFYRTHGDDYDFLVIFTNFDFIMPPGAKAFFSPARNNTQGIGLALSDYTNSYSYDGLYLDRLEGTIDMGYIAEQSLEPTEPEFDDTLLTLSHEMAHRWSAYIQFDDNGSPSNALLGLDNAHWSFLFDSGGSTFYGSNWQDNGDGTFTTIAPELAQENNPIGRLFSPLDLYLMGLIDKSQVPPMTLIETTDMVGDRIPEIDVTVTGTAKTVTIDDIIAIEGERAPSAADARKEFRTAFIYAVNPGSWAETDPQDLGEIAAINRLQTEWAKRFSILTDGTAIVSSEFVIEEVVDINPGVTEPITSAHVAPHVNEGVGWLINNQRGDGSWQDQPGTAQRDTATAVAALKQFPAGSSSASSGQTWLGGVTSENSDFLARKLLSFDSANLSEIESLQNSDGGWGSAPGYRSNPIDTALALKALTTHASTNTAVIDAAINYLHSSQNPDGGWDTGLGLSMVQPTAYALLALNDYRDNPGYTLEPAIADGIDWLDAKQNGNGGFGNSPSTVYDTSSALTALKAVGGTQTVTDSAITYLLTTQDDSGSWNDSAFQTAMAVEALYAGQVAADLALETSDITFNPPVLDTVPADVTITVNVHNRGRNDANSVAVALYEGDPSLGVLLDEKVIDLSGHSTKVVSLATTITAFGLLPYFVVLDHDDQIAESDERNNMAYKTLAVNLPPPTIDFVMTTSSGAEAQSTVNLEVRLEYPWHEPVTVEYSVNAASTAVPSLDYLLNSGILTFSPEEITKSIVIDILNDAIAETDKAIVVNLANPSVGTLGSSQYIYTILDDESPAITIISPNPGSNSSNTPQLLFNTTGSNVVVTVDGVAVDKNSGDTLGPLADGPYIVEISVTNGLGLNSTARVDFSVDASLPEVVILSPVAGSYPAEFVPLTYTLSKGDIQEISLNGNVISDRNGSSPGAVGSR